MSTVVEAGLVSSAVWVAVEIGLAASVVLSTLPNPTSALTNASVVFNWAGVRDAQRSTTDWMTLSVVAVSPAIVVRSVSSGCLPASAVSSPVMSAASTLRRRR